MTIEVGERLQEFRKKSGYSQEEIAEKLKVSRQSVSNWESGEATPSLDYLIELSKIYGCSIDDLVKMDKNVEDCINNDKEEDHKGDYVDISLNGIHVKDSESGDEVHISPMGIHVKDGEHGEKVDISLNGINVNNSEFDIEKLRRKRRLSEAIHGASLFASIIAYLLLGILTLNGWWIHWPLVFSFIVIGGISDMFIYKKASKFPIAVVCTMVYCYLGTILNLWHPTWTIFILIPLFYCIVNPIEDAIKAKKKDKNIAVIIKDE